jgi:predicted phage terminase large subunit-like protein
VNVHVAPSDAARELIYRRTRRHSLIAYARSIDIPGVPVKPDDPDCEDFKPFAVDASGFAAHHLLWLKCLQDVEDGKIPRLLGMWPPGTAKSTFTSVVFPTHVMGRFPASTIIEASYGSDLPRKFGRRARAIVKQPQYRRIFGATLSAESSAADEWSLTSGSEFMGAGILAGLTGNRADGIIWDDLIKGREQADSDTIRNKTWEAYFDDLLTRKKPGAFEIGITTRWHEDDVAGRILPERYNGESGWIDGRDGNRWYVVCIQAECERSDDILGRKIGERIWPEWFPEDHFRPFKLNTRTWSALYQQRPAPQEGAFFKKEWLMPYRQGQHPNLKTLAIYGGSDYATKKDGGDYTVHVVIGIDPDDRPWLLDLWRAQTTSDQWVNAWCDLVKKWKPLFWGEERGQIISAVGPFLDREAKKQKAFTAREQFVSNENKKLRARSIQGYIATHKLHVPSDAPWYEAFENEYLTFDAGVHDDQVDALSKVGQLLDKLAKGQKLKPPSEEKVSGYAPSQRDVLGDTGIKTL